MAVAGELETWLERAGREYHQRKKAAEARLATWQWMTRPGRHALDPVYYQRNDFGCGKPLAKPPSPPKILNVAYGLDDDGRIVVERECCTLDGKSFYRTFYEWRDDVVEWVRYDSDLNPQRVHRARLDGGRVVEMEMQADFGGYRTRFEWEGARLARIDETHIAQNGRETRRHFEVGWDLTGKLASIVCRDGADETVKYEARARGVTLTSLLAAAVDAIVEAMPAIVRAMKLEEPACALVVAYPGDGNDNFPPTVGVCSERERADAIARGSAVASALWNPGDFEQYDTEVEPLAAHAELFRRLNQEISQKDAWPQMHKAFAQVAKRLRPFEWSRVLRTTDDFTVIAVDYGETRLPSALRAALPAKTYVAWKKRGWAR